MPSKRRFSRALYAGLMVFALGGCRSEGPAERAGRKLDETVDDLTRSKGPVERAGEKIDKAVDSAGEALEETGKKARKSIK